MHMVIAMELLYDSLRDSIRILGGDTDSMKVSCDECVTNEQLLNALEPIAAASTKSIHRCMERLRNNFPDLASGLNGIGAFEIENANNHYPIHYEMWNKARVSWDGKHVHITCAGLPRPIGKYTIETFLEELIYGNRSGTESMETVVGRVFESALGSDTFVAWDIAHTLEHHRPKASDVYDSRVVDYLGNDVRVHAHESVSLYSSGRWLGETLKQTNRLSVSFLRRRYGRDMGTGSKYLSTCRKTGRARLLRDSEAGLTEIMRG